MTDEELNEIEARANLASDGPWAQHPIHRKAVHMPGEGWIPDTNADAEFIAHARTDVPRLVARVRELEAALRRAATTAPKDPNP
jgi:hypothetical protein